MNTHYQIHTDGEKTGEADGEWIAVASIRGLAEHLHLAGPL